MRSRIWILNILFFFLICLSGVKTYDLWVTDPFLHENLSISENEKNYQAKLNLDQSESGYNKSHYEAIISKNLFFSDRTGRMNMETSERAQPEKIHGLPEKIVLYGIIISGDKRKALLGNPYATDKESSNIWVKAGDDINGPGKEPGIKIKEIHKDKIVMMFQGKTHIAKMYKDKTENTKAPSGNHMLNTRSSGSVSPSRQVQQPPTEISPDGRFKIIETPFGKIKRRIN